ncbi:MAG: RluA family pseudouridine synthase [Lachnospiraceae bacterium]|nr:RluA family pseudouridine synthase [Lachnospiraceae bacterium]
MKTEILFEDEDILVVHKLPGMATESGRLGEMDVVSELKNHLAHSVGENVVPFVGMVHRLDQPVEGILVFGKNKEATSELSSQVAKASAGFLKKYKAVVYGQMARMEDSLFHYVRRGPGNKTIVRRGEGPLGIDERRAELSYKVVAIRKNETELEVKLGTGRYHQIRAQLAYIGFPILADTKYGSEESKQYSKQMDIKQLQLFAKELSFVHPKTGEKMHFSISV